MSRMLSIAGLAVALAAGSSQAGGPPTQAYLDLAAQGPGVCQAALPSFEGQIRKRPLAIQNEGTATAFVSCAIPQFTDPALNDPEFGLAVSFVNYSGAAVTINCTGVAIGEEIAYIPKSIELAAGTDIGAPDAFLSWNEGDEGGGAYNVVSCALPPGAGITFVENLSGLVALPAPPEV